MDGRISCAQADDRDVIQIRTTLDKRRTKDSLGTTEKDGIMRKLAFILGLLAAPAAAHEFWLEPLAYQINLNDNLAANIVNGQDFEGVKLPFVPRKFTHFINFAGNNSAQVSSRLGDSPALNQAPVSEGLNIVAYQAVNLDVSYETWEKFKKFLDHKDLGDQLANHKARGLALVNFKEIYSRYSKTLIGVGNAAGSDQRAGLETEIVALTNPYTDDLLLGMRVQLFYRTDIRANAQIEVFEKSPTGDIDIFMVQTDGEGIATIPVKSEHSYMLDAVVLREPTVQLAADTDAAWETLWANLTFMAP